MNKVILMGRLTKDPEVRYSQSETPMAIVRYTLAVKNPRSKSSENATDFIEVVAFSKQGEFAEKHLKKGSLIALSGRLHLNRWEDAEHGKHSKMEVIAEDQHFAGYGRVKKTESEIEITEGQIAISDLESQSEDAYISDLPY